MDILGSEVRESLHVPDYLGVENADYSRAVAYVDGEFVPYLDAKISIRDFGLTRADVTYDVVHTWKGAFFRLEDHLDRFENSLQGMRLDPGLNRAKLRAVLSECVRRTRLKDTLVYFACTRGAPPLGSRDSGRCANKFFAHVQPLVLRGTPEEMRRGLNLKISETVRRIPSNSVDSTCKNVHWGDFTRAQFSAKDEGYDTVVLTDQAGDVTEGPGFNVVAVVENDLITPDANVLEGISCRTMMELSRSIGIRARYGKLSPQILRSADEAFITSTSCGLFPVTQVDGRAIGNGSPGAITTRLLNLYYKKKDEGWLMTPVDAN